MAVAIAPDRPDALSFAPLDLADAPDVDALLHQLGLGTFDRESVWAPPGRNDIWTGRTTAGAQVLVKRLTGPPADVAARMDRALTFEEFARTALGHAVPTPPLLGADRPAALVAFEYLHGARTGAELMVAEAFDEALATEAGRLVGAVHAATAPRPLALTSDAPFLPAPELLHGVPAALFDSATSAELAAWRLMQSDTGLREAVVALRAWEARAPRVPAHCDLRVDQFLLADGRLHLADWEEFRLADPARDVGAFAGEWLYRAVLDIVTTRGGQPAIGVDLSHDEVVERGVRNLERLRGRVRRFWAGYTAVRPGIDPDLAARATAFAGWHLLDRLLVGAARATRLSGIERAAAGIGRAALVDPHRFADAVGLGGRP